MVKGIILSGGIECMYLQRLEEMIIPENVVGQGDQLVVG